MDHGQSYARNYNTEVVHDMIPILYSTITEGSVPSHYGVGSLTDCLSCKVTEERNGPFELVLEYPMEGVHADEIEPNKFIKAKPNFSQDPQLFRIYKVGKVLSGKFIVYAQHISYDLSGKIITSGTASSCSAACTLLTGQAGNFTITTNKSLNAPFKITEPSSVRSWFGGKAGSILDVYGPGEWEWDNYTATFKANRGADRDVYIRYGKNLTELSQEINIENLCTGVVPYYIDQDGNVTTGTKVNTGLVLDVPKDVAIDFTQDVNPDSGTAITTQLAALANRYINNNILTTMINSITLDFVQLSTITDRVDLCDTVHIIFEALGITGTAKCVRTEWDVLGDRYIKSTFGTVQTNIADTFVQVQKTANSAANRSYMAEAIAHATELITGNLGGYVILHDSNADSFPDEILIMDTADITTAEKVWRWNKNGLGYSGSGYAGPFSTLALTADGKIVADAITTGTLNADLIKAGVISDLNNKFAIDMLNGTSVLDQMKSKTSISVVTTGLADRIKMGYTNSSGTTVRLFHTDGTPIADLEASINGFGGLFLSGPSGVLVNPQAILQVDSNGGHLTLKAASGSPYVHLCDDNDNILATLYTIASGGSLELKEPNGNTQVSAWCSASGGQINLKEHGSDPGSAIYVKDENNTALVGIYTTTSGASFYLANRSTGMPRLSCSITSDGGSVSVGSNAQTVCYLFANSAGGGTMSLKNANNTFTITCSGDTGNITCVSLTQTSSRKVKKNIKPIKDARKILELEAVQFDYKDDVQGKNKRGFIAEDVEQVLPNLVSKATDEIPATLDYLQMIPYLQSVIKEQDERIKALEDKIKQIGG